MSVVIVYDSVCLCVCALCLVLCMKERMFIYNYLVSSLQKRLGEVSDQAGQINKEEELFKWTPTTYPQIDTIHSQLEPYQRLFSTVFKWQKAEKKFMDGAFLDLNAEETQSEVES